MDTSQMKGMWNQRAKLDAFYYVESSFWDGNIDAFFALGEERAQLFIDPIIAEMTPSASKACALEIGCGVGRFSRALASRLSSVVAVDVSDEMVHLARKLHPSDQYPNLRFCATDGKSISSVQAGSIDFVFSYEVFQHMPSFEVILNNFHDIRRVLQPRGVALIHLRTEPLLSLTTGKHFMKHFVPERVWTLLKIAPLTIDSTWTGRSLNRKSIQKLCNLADLKLLNLIDDPTHSPGTRKFLLATPVERSI